MNGAMAAFLLLSCPQQRRDTPARDIQASEVSNPTVTTETSKIARSPERESKYTTSAIVVSPSAAVTEVFTTAALVSPHCFTMCASVSRIEMRVAMARQKIRHTSRRWYFTQRIMPYLAASQRSDRTRLAG